MADYQENVSSCLPFYDLTDREFKAMVGSWLDGLHDLDLYDLFLRYPVVSIQSRFDTSRFDTNRSRFDTNEKSFRYTCKVDSIQTEVNSIQPLFT